MLLHAILDTEKFHKWVAPSLDKRMRMTLIVCNSKYRYEEAAVEGGGERQVHGGMGNSK